MIRYSLICQNSHEFEGWFSSSADFDIQRKRGFVECAHCGSAKVEKRMMAPGVARTDSRAVSALAGPAAADPAPAAPVALIDERQKAMREMMKAFRDHVAKNTDDVGRAFPEEARKIHFGETEKRSIRGEAAPDEVRALLEEGVDIMPVPTLPEDHH